MFNSTLTGNTRVWFDDFPTESIDSYDDLKKAFLENYLQQKKCIKDPIELHNIKQRDEESTEDFVRRYNLESRDVKGAPKCMRISGFMHGITNPELIKRLHDKIPKTANEMMRVTTSFLRGVVAASSHERKIVSTMETARGITQSFSPNTEILFPPLDEEEGTEGPVNIEAEIRGRCIHRMTNITTGKNWRRRTLRFGLDEFRSGKVTISVHRNNWKTKTQETASSSVNSSLHAEAPSRKRSNYPIKQQKLADMTGVPRHIVEHHLNVREGCSLVRQKKRGQAGDRNQMPFGLRNAGATYQCLVDKAFHKHIGRNFKVYVDDLVIKSLTEDEIVRDIEETFKTLREVNMKLNIKMCTF
nr:reverse transcriptase domain-containing protein [Tanacetum cinerariifolium]